MEEKEDRIAVIREKRKRYGTKGMNKDENQNLKRRTEEKKELAMAKSNYWKWHRGGGKGEKREENAPRWENLKKAITELDNRELKRRESDGGLDEDRTTETKNDKMSEAVTSKEAHDRDGVSEAVTSTGKMRAVTPKETDDRDGVSEAVTILGERWNGR